MTSASTCGHIGRKTLQLIQRCGSPSSSSSIEGFRWSPLEYSLSSRAAYLAPCHPLLCRVCYASDTLNGQRKFLSPLGNARLLKQHTPLFSHTRLAWKEGIESSFSVFHQPYQRTFFPPLFAHASHEFQGSTHEPRSRDFASSSYRVTQEGTFGSLDYGVFAVDAKAQKMSLWHDIPLMAQLPKKERAVSCSSKVFNMVVEIPKYTTAKMEIATRVPYNPIMQDIKDNKPRFYHGPIFWHYGALPQTWEDPEEVQQEGGTSVRGDNDPLDVVEISGSGSKSAPKHVGDITQIKVLGALCLIDGGELDWKILAVDVEDPRSCELNDVGDIDRVYPGTTSGVREWFRWYKTPDGKPVNIFGFNGTVLGKNEAEQIIRNNHAAYKRLRTENPWGLWVKPEMTGTNEEL